MFLNNNSPFSPFPCALSGDAASLSSLPPPAAVVPRLLFATEAATQTIIQSINQSWIFIAHKCKASNALVR